jgi:hypothetical protein
MAHSGHGNQMAAPERIQSSRLNFPDRNGGQVGDLAGSKANRLTVSTGENPAADPTPYQCDAVIY